MAPPFYADLGKNARDVFGKGYHFGLLKLDVKTKTNTGVEFSIGGVQNLESKNVVGSLETKYKFKDYGVTFTEKWNTDNILATEVAIADFCEGAKLSVDTSFLPHKGKTNIKVKGEYKTGPLKFQVANSYKVADGKTDNIKVKGEYKMGALKFEVASSYKVAEGDKTLRLKGEFKNDTCAMNMESDFKSGGPLVRASSVLGYGGWLCGYATAFDTSKNKLTENKVTMGFVTKDFILNTVINDGRVFSGSIYHKVNSKLETGVQISWASDSNSTDFGIGCKYNLDSDAALRFKVNNQSLLGIGYSQKLREGVTISLSTQINGKNFKEGGHNAGFCLELDA